MSKAPDLSAFPIPRKGGARPIIGDDIIREATDGGGEGARPDRLGSPPIEAPTREPEPAAAPQHTVAPKGGEAAPRSARTAPISRPPPPPQSYGQTVATTVKLDENRYLRLMEAGKPGPGRLKRRTIQDMLIEALDEWFERRRL
jgi:hypothetical protein